MKKVLFVLGVLFALNSHAQKTYKSTHLEKYEYNDSCGEVVLTREKDEVHTFVIGKLKVTSHCLNCSIKKHEFEIAENQVPWIERMDSISVLCFYATETIDDVEILFLISFTDKGIKSIGLLTSDMNRMTLFTNLKEVFGIEQ